MSSELRFLPEQASQMAPKIDHLYFFLCGLTAFFTLLIFLTVVYLGIKYRRRTEHDRTPNVHPPIQLEIAWTVVPLAIVMVIFVWATKLYIEIYSPPTNAMDIHVIGKQWMWKIQHPEGRREINELHVPVGRAVRLTLASQDVIHSFYVPAFRIKQDALPGRYTAIGFTPSVAGEYHLFCAEYCGNQHSGMIGKVTVMLPEKYQEWLSGAPADESPVAAGARLFASLNCINCHGVQAPTLAGVYTSTVQLNDGSTVTADEDYLRESILNSTAKIVKGYPPIMPSFRGQISEEQLFDLIAYIKSLKESSQSQPGLPDRPVRPAPANEPTANPPVPGVEEGGRGPKPANNPAPASPNPKGA